MNNILLCLAILSPLAANAARKPSSTSNSWTELARFTGSESLSDVKQTRPITKDDLLNCQFRLAVSTFKDANDITDIVFPVGISVNGKYATIQFLGKPEATLGSGGSAVAPVTLQLSEDKVTTFDADGPLSQSRRTKILQALCP